MLTYVRPSVRPFVTLVQSCWADWDAIWQGRLCGLSNILFDRALVGRRKGKILGRDSSKNVHCKLRSNRYRQRNGYYRQQHIIQWYHCWPARTQNSTDAVMPPTVLGRLLPTATVSTCMASRTTVQIVSSHIGSDHISKSTLSEARTT